MSAAVPRGRQFAVLSARYRRLTWGDLPTLGLLLGQAPVIGALCAWVWGRVEGDTPTLWFVLCLSAVWFGCIDACREIVKERAILEREREFGLSMVAYVGSKLRVLAGVVALQVLLLQGTVELRFALRGPFGVELLALWLAGMVGVALGLVVSAFAARAERAVGAVPLLLLPQVLLSELAIPDRHFSGWLWWARALSPVHHAFRVFQHLAAAETRWIDALGAILLLPIGGLALAALAVGLLQRVQDR